MPFPRPISSSLHGATDYTVGTLLMTVLPRLAGAQGTETAKQMRAAGAVHAGYSLFTNYEVGAVKAVPYKAHLGLDALWMLGVAATPFVTGQWTKGKRHYVPHLALAAFEFGSLLMSDPTGRGDYHGDVDAVREANMEDSKAKIYNGGPAVVPAVA
jgi:hypothetical protein